MWPYGRGQVPHPAPSPLLQNSTGYNPGGNPQMPLPLPQNPIVYNPGGNPQMPLPLPQNPTVYNPGGYPQMPLPLPQNLTLFNPGGYPQMPLPLFQNPTVYSWRGNPEMPRNSLVYNPGGNPQMLQNPTVYNPGGNSQRPSPLLQNSTFYNPEVQNQQVKIFPNYVSYAPYSDHARPVSYSQQERRVPVTQDQMAGDQNWLFQNRYRRESRPLDFQNGEVVMVRCNQQKWLYGLIQRMSVQGLRIWIADANILVNVPLVLVPTHVLKMSMLPELQGVPPPEPVWTMSFTDENESRKSLVQCVRPAHLSHRQLFHKFGCMECAICGTSVSAINVVSPWNCSHQVHDYCLQLRMQHTSTPVCPSCEPPSSRDDRPTLQLVPSTFAGTGSELQSTSSSNEQPQQWLDLQCACGFRGSVDSACIGNMNAYVFCPNCHRPVNVNRSEDLPRAYSDSDREILQRKSVPEQEVGWNTFQSFSGFSRLEAIQEGSLEGICSTPPSPDQTDGLNMQPSPSFPSSLLDDLLTALPPTQVTKGISSARSSLQDGLLIALSPPQVTKATSSPRSSFVPTAPSPPQVAKRKSTVQISFQDEVTTAPSPPQWGNPVLEVGKSCARSSLEDATLTAPFPPQVTLNQKGKSGTRISFQNDVLTAPSPLQVKKGKLTDRNSMEGGLLTAPPSTQDTQNEQYSSTRSSLQDEPSSSRSTLIRQDDASPSDAQNNHLTIPEADESSGRVLEAETPSLSAPHRQNLFRTASQVDWMTGDFDDESEERQEASSSNDFAVIAPNTPPVYVNHFENFVKLAMASESTAKEILANAAASPSSSETEVLSPPAAFFSRGPEAPANVTPLRAFCSRPPALLPPGPVSESANIAQTRALFSRAAEPPALVTEGAIVKPARALFSRAAGMITEAPAWVTEVIDPNGSGPSGETPPAWITVIKDGVDSRKEDPQQWESDRLARKKEAGFF